MLYNLISILYTHGLSNTRFHAVSNDKCLPIIQHHCVYGICSTDTSHFSRSQRSCPNFDTVALGIMYHDQVPIFRVQWWLNDLWQGRFTRPDRNVRIVTSHRPCVFLALKSPWNLVINLAGGIFHVISLVIPRRSRELRMFPGLYYRRAVTEKVLENKALHVNGLPA
ncbi:hypothetical protein FA15DRAFT_663647 [Coprinopsis marcescibilis]|uniref:Uncharacterized protein n=1 Tax=Coprinopsis marcescibilis TaxID=230819 RepID=A0A5C3LBU3_COPMA|nr:hypothetical protein FA15DRAFT_663647 [Coprinopsis marcescibilis]